MLIAPSRALIAIPTYYWPTHPLFRSHRSAIKTLDFHFLSHNSHNMAAISKAITGLDLLASWIPYGFDWASLMMTWDILALPGDNFGMTWGWLGDDLGTTLAKLGKTCEYIWTEYYRVLQSITEWNRVKQGETEWSRVKQSETEWNRVKQSITEYNRVKQGITGYNRV